MAQTEMPTMLLLLVPMMQTDPQDPGNPTMPIYHRQDNTPEIEFARYTYISGYGLDMMNFDMPGVKVWDVKIKVEGKMLYVQGDRYMGAFVDSDGNTEELREREEAHDAVEIKLYKSYRGVFHFRCVLNPDLMVVRLEDGVLSVVLPSQYPRGS